jgi:hypothetical protein
MASLVTSGTGTGRISTTNDTTQDHKTITDTQLDNTIKRKSQSSPVARKSNASMIPLQPQSTQYYNPNTPEYDALYKICLVGDSGVGKSSVFVQFLDKQFNEHFLSTFGVDMVSFSSSSF